MSIEYATDQHVSSVQGVGGISIRLRLFRELHATEHKLDETFSARTDHMNATQTDL